MTASEAIAAVLEDKQLELFNEKDMISFQEVPSPQNVRTKYEPGDRHGTYKHLKAYWRGREVGFVQFTYDEYRNPEWLEITFMRINKEFRGLGLGKRLYERFYAFIRRAFPKVRKIDGSVTSQGIAKLRQRAIPVHTRFADHGTGNPLPKRDAMRRLPAQSPEDEDGHIDGTGVFMTQTIPRRANRVVEMLLA